MKLRIKFSFLAIVAVFCFTTIVNAQPGLQRALAAQKAHNPNFFNLEGVEATGISVDNRGNAIIKVYTSHGDVKGIPPFVNGVKVTKSVSGHISAWDNPIEQFGRGGNGNGNGNGGDGGDTGSTDPQSRLDRPVPIGASIGTYRPNASNLCFAGTLGCRLKRISPSGVSHFILSNNHVIAEQNAGTSGVDQILQPGTLDSNCTITLSDVIGTLTDFEPIKFNGQSNLVDAAIAATTTSDTGFASPTDAYGAPTALTQAAFVGMAVQKFGRTTGFTQGEVDAINVTVNVAYDVGTARFDNQIIIIGKRRRGKRLVDATFSDGGDSGSLIVTQGDNDPIGLLFAGNTSVTIANPIDTVLDTFSDPANGVFFVIDDGN